ncbi:MAG: hypothetical protein HY331_02800 [Chloroflexi bacterium]|nr:hypothetical protein [Chloroflexota bacterium]
MSAPDQADRPSELSQDPIAARLAALEKLRALAERAAGYLRRSALPAVRLSAALLLAASLAACDRAEDVAEEVPPAQVQPLTQEVATGLPDRPGRYAVQADSVFRDQRGVYQFAWLEPGAGGSQAPRGAYASRLRLAQGDRPELEVPDQGDPVLYLPPSQPVRLVEAGVAGASPTPAPGSSTTYVAPHYPYWAMWYPFPVGGTGYSRPTYYDPPSRTVEPGQRVDGGVASTTPKPFGDRVAGIRTAVSGQAGGTGSGSAVTNKSGAGGKSGVTAPKSGGFSSGRGSVGSSSSS